LKDYIAIAEQYARDIVSGQILACRWIKLACQRHLDDLAKSATSDYPYTFNAEKADRVCRFAEELPHVKGRWSNKGQKLVLQPWQCFILCSIFGWLRKHDGLRRFRTALLYIPRKNGKSFLSSVVGLYMLAFDDEAAAEVLCGATTEAQAQFVFRPAQQMVERMPGLRKRIQSLANSLQLPDGSKMVTVCGQPPDGSSPSCALLDESHEWPNDLLLSTMQTGMGAREQPLTFITTTAGYETTSPAKLMQDDLQDVLLGVKQDEELFGVIYTVDEGDDWTSEIALRKANPNLDVSTDLGRVDVP
jgi:phage terminase large subunit-like protein